MNTRRPIYRDTPVWGRADDGDAARDVGYWFEGWSSWGALADFIEHNLLAQMTPREGRHRDEMMLNSSPRHDVYPLPNFEPASKVLDMNEDDIASNEVTERDRVVSQTYKNFLDAASDNPAVKLMPMWGTSDRMMWLNDGPTHHRKQPNRAQRSLPFDTEYRPTPAFLAMRNNFNVHTI